MIKELYAVRVLTGPRKASREQYARLERLTGAYKIEFSPNFGQESVLTLERAMIALEMARESPKIFRSPKLIRVTFGTQVSAARVNTLLAESLQRKKGLSAQDVRLLRRA